MKERIILDSMREELGDSKVSGLISNSEMYKSSSKSASRVSKVRGNLKSYSKKPQCDQSANRKTCFKCGDKGHLKSSCPKQVLDMRNLLLIIQRAMGSLSGVWVS